MSSSLIIALMACGLGVCLGAFTVWLYWMNRNREHKTKIRAFSKKAEELSRNYDVYRRKYLDLDDQYRKLKSEEQTYRIAFQEWKTKYEDLSAEVGSFPNQQVQSSRHPIDKLDEWKEKALHFAQLNQSLQDEMARIKKERTLESNLKDDNHLSDRLKTLSKELEILSNILSPIDGHFPRSKNPLVVSDLLDDE